MHPAAIGPYQIQRELGRGGMGEVYLARDTRLDRDVAIKALPAHLAGDPDRLARFQREAKALASLNHPGVGAIYGLEESEGHRYLILEYIQGETLLDRLGGGSIPVQEALSIARQIAEALEAAHEKGIVHRDLKPANVMLTPEGVVKVLDFGLARTAEGTPSSMTLPVAPDSPTVPVNSPTIPGAIMGTAGYMSPEQARGKPVDKRSDIFSFGCVFYEMLSGKGPFPGETVTDSLGAILHKDPDWAALPASTPPRVRELLRNCLAKDRRSRLHDIGDARLELERAIAGHEWASALAPPTAPPAPRRVALGVLAAAALLGAGWALATFLARPAPTPSPAQQSFHVTTTTPAEPELDYLAAIAPDARFFVYRARPNLAAESVKPDGVLMIRRLDRDETKVIEGTEGVLEAAISPDGRWLAFTSVKDLTRSKITLKKIALENGRPSGTPETLCELPPGGSPALCWSSDRDIVLAMTWEQTILTVSASGGEPRVVLHEEQSKGIDNWGEVFPLVPGKSILATRWSLVGQTIKERTEIVDLASGARTPLLLNAGRAQFLPGGYIVAARNLNTLIAARFDPDTLRIIGEPVTVWSGKPLNRFYLAPSGTLAMVTQSADMVGRKLAWIDDQGLPVLIPGVPRPYGEIVISPDGGRVAATLDSTDMSELASDIWVLDLTRRTFTRLPTQGPTWQFVWSNDAQRIAHGVISDGTFSIWERNSDGSGQPRKLYDSTSQNFLLAPRSWSPDDTVLAFVQADLTKGTADVLMLKQESRTEPHLHTARPYLDSPASEDSLHFSHDGTWVRFNSDESGRSELYVQPFSGYESGRADAIAGRIQVSTTGAFGGSWLSPDATELRYVDTDGQIISVTMQTTPRLSASTPKVLYSIKNLKIRSRTFAPDGRLMVVLRSEDESTPKIDLIVNFADELRAKVGNTP